MKICHINLAKGFRGGERQTFLLVRALSGRVDQTVVVRKGSALAQRLSELNRIKVVEIAKPFFINTLKLGGFSLVHGHEAKGAHIAMLVNLVHKTPYIVTRRVLKVPHTNFFSSMVYRNAKKVVAISNEISRILQQYDKGIGTRVIHSSFARLDVDDASVRQLKDRYDGKFVVGHVGALENRDKGQVYIIEAAKKIACEFPDIHFLFLGSGSDEQSFRERASGFDNIEFAGFKSNIGDYYKAFDVFLYPSLNEGLGSAVLDAFYFELPVITSRVGGIPDMVGDYRTGIFVPPGDAGAIREKVIELYQDGSLCKELGKNGKSSLARFDIAGAAEKYLELYGECARSAGNS
ncbi:MAG: glycosyltransferase family 4 protein [Desulfobacteraceae bacterium]|nr:glycosyltransferase family 4 protein [Desulfobacteraceae bacterium]